MYCNNQQKRNGQCRRFYSDVYTGVLFLMVIILSLPGSDVFAMQKEVLQSYESALSGDSTFTSTMFYRVPVEDKISLDLHRETIENSLRELARKTGLRLTYSGDINTDKRITLVNEGISVSEALDKILEGTGLEYHFSFNGFLLITRINVDNNPERTQTENTDEQQTGFGSIYGEVRDADTGETLPGANIFVQNTNIGVATDIDGRYTLRRVPVGNQVLEIRYLGFQTQEIPVTVTRDERLNQNITLQSDLIEGDEILVLARQRGQARALTRQRESVNIRAVVSSEQIDRFADQTVDGALQRIAGMGHGGDNIRGVGAGMSSVVVDGQRLGSTGPGSRSTDISTISVDIVQDLEVIKVITPDMDADALSGVIRINTRRPAGGERDFNVRLGGGWNSRFLTDVGPNTRASVSYGDSPDDHYSYGLNFSYQNDMQGSESFSSDWQLKTFEETGPINVLNNFSNRLQLVPNKRVGGGAQFTFQPTERSTFHVRGMVNYNEQKDMSWGTRYRMEVESYTTPTQTGPIPGSQRRIFYNAALIESQTHQFTFQVGGRHLFDAFDMQYALGWGHGRFNSDSYDWVFLTESRYDFLLDLEDPWHPIIDLAPHGTPTFPRSNQLRFDQWTKMPYQWDSHVDNEFKGSIDLEIPIERGSIKFGSSTLLSFKDGVQETFLSDYDLRPAVSEFDLKFTSWNVFDRTHQTYQIPWLIDLEKARDLYHSQRPRFRVEMLDWAAATRDYRADEHVFAGYGMGTMEFGRFRFVGGVRVEHSRTAYYGDVITIDPGGMLQGIVGTLNRNDYTHFFPNAQMIFALGRFSNVRAAYSRSIGRPGYDQLSPRLVKDYNTRRITMGNPELNPMISNNLDFLVEHYFMSVGQISLGLYYKELSDFAYSFSERIGEEGFEGDEFFEGWRLTSYLSGNEATVYGVEFSWQQHLTYLPGFLGNFGLYANVAYSQSLADVGRRDGNGDVIYALLRDHRPYVVNAGLDYSQGGFSGQITYQWGAPSINAYGEQILVSGVRGIPDNERVYFDRYRDAANDLSLSLRYRITNEIRIWADITNMLNHRSVDYYYNRDIYPDRVSLRGRTVNMGIRYTL